jgi:hypothetical protein
MMLLIAHSGVTKTLIVERGRENGRMHGAARASDGTR